MSLAAKAQELINELPILLLEESQRFSEVFQAVVAEFWHNKTNPRADGRNTTTKLYKRTGDLTRALVRGKRGNILKRSVTNAGLQIQYGINLEEIPYARVHDLGGTFTITSKQRGFFWYKYISTGQEFWKWLALAKTYTIPARPYFTPAAEKMQKEYGEALVKGLLTKKLIELWNQA